MEIGASPLRVLENLPVLGHILALFYMCMGHVSSAERAAIKATVGILLAIVNLPAEIIDEIRRRRAPRQYSISLTPRPDWMKAFRRRTLRHLCLPGSHQSATYTVTRRLRKIPMVVGWSKCQKFDIWTQLVGGIRFLDLRIMSDKETKEVWTHHNVVLCAKFKDVLKSVRNFIKEYPSEIVSLYLTNDGKHLDWSQVRGYINEYIGAHHIIPEFMNEMFIDDITTHGRNVIFYGVPNVAFSWNNLDYRWPNKTDPDELREDMSQTVQDLVMYNPYAVFWYKAECQTSAAMITRDIGGVVGALAAKKVAYKYTYMEDLAAITNHLTLTLLQDAKRLPLNILTTDYVDDDIISRIIQMNKNEETGAGPMQAGSRLNSMTSVGTSRSGNSLSHSSSVGLSRSFAGSLANRSFMASISGQDEPDQLCARMLSRSLNYIAEESVFIEDDEDSQPSTSLLLQVRETTC